MVKAVVFDFSRVLLHPVDTAYKDGLNDLHKALKDTPGYKATDHLVLNTELLDFLKTIHHVSFYIFTTGYVQEEQAFRKELDPIFEAIYTIRDVKAEKDTPEAYKNLAKLLDVQPEEIVFIDDTLKNISAAKRIGVQTIRHVTNANTMSALHAHLFTKW